MKDNERTKRDVVCKERLTHAEMDGQGQYTRLDTLTTMIRVL